MEETYSLCQEHMSWFQQLKCSCFSSFPYHDLEPGFHQVRHTLVPHCVLDHRVAGVLLDVEGQRSEFRG